MGGIERESQGKHGKMVSKKGKKTQSAWMKRCKKIKGTAKKLYKKWKKGKVGKQEYIQTKKQNGGKNVNGRVVDEGEERGELMEICECRKEKEENDK